MLLPCHLLLVMLIDISTVWNHVTEIRDSLLLMRLERSVNRQDVLAAAVSTRTIDQAFNCRHNRPLFVSLFTDPTIQQSLIQVQPARDGNALVLEDATVCFHMYFCA